MPERTLAEGLLESMQSQASGGDESSGRPVPISLKTSHYLARIAQNLGKPIMFNGSKKELSGFTVNKVIEMLRVQYPNDDGLLSHVLKVAIDTTRYNGLGGVRPELDSYVPAH